MAQGWWKAGAMVVAGAAAPAWADAERGAKAYQAYCSSCHVAEKGAGARMAPNLWGVVGRKAAATPFGYSPAMRASKVVWTRAVLDPYLTDPRAVVPGTSMMMRVKDAQKRQDILDYLETLQ